MKVRQTAATIRVPHSTMATRAALSEGGQTLRATPDYRRLADEQLASLAGFAK